MSFLDGLNRPFFIFLVVQLWVRGENDVVDCCNERLKNYKVKLDMRFLVQIPICT
jgi:hypothetical protein